MSDIAPYQRQASNTCRGGSGTLAHRVRAELDTGKYPLGVEVPEEDLATIRLRKHRVHGEWNYTIAPRRR